MASVWSILPIPLVSVGGLVTTFSLSVKEFQPEESTEVSGAFTGEELPGDGYGCTGLRIFFIARELLMFTLAALIAPACATSIISSSSSSLISCLMCAFLWATLAAGEDGAGSLIGTFVISGKSSSLVGRNASSSSSKLVAGGGEGNLVSTVFFFLRAGSGAGESALAFRRSPDLSIFDILGAGAGMLWSTSPRRSARKSSSAFVLTT